VAESANIGSSRDGAVVSRYDAVDSIVGLARTLRAAGAPASPDRVHNTLRALQLLRPARRDDVYWAGRLTLCDTPADIERYDRVFAAYFGDRPASIQRRARVNRPQLQLVASGGMEAPEEDQGGEPTGARSAASSEEVLRHRDIATLSVADRDQLRLLLARLALPGETRSTRRMQVARRGPIDGRRTVRAWLAAGGEPAQLKRHRHAQRPRRVILLVDVSGSMGAYADALLRFSHAAARRRGRGPTEVFALGTRLSRLTKELHQADPDEAMSAVATAMPDAGGGTRLGLLLKEFLDQWGQRGLARGAVVVVLSDGWERGDPALLGEQTARLQRLAHRVVWSNPRKAAPGFAPIAGGMAAALPHVDDFVEGHSLEALLHLADVVRGHRLAGRR
jgi:uncharacterized protein with von Willebrand factor type A (vWA) domain